MTSTTVNILVMSSHYKNLTSELIVSKAEHFCHKSQFSQIEYLQCLLDIRVLERTGLDLAFLTRAIAALPNCRTITFNDNIQSWAVERLARKIGENFRGAAIQHFQPVQRAFEILMTAVTASSMPIEKLSICVGCDYAESSNTPQMLALPAYHLACLKPSFNTLRQLDLTLNPLNVPWGPNGNGIHLQWQGKCKTFFKSLPALTHLNLAFHPLTLDVGFKIVSDGLHIPNLKVLTLAGFSSTASEMMQLLYRHKNTLKRLSLVEVCLDKHEWQSLLTMIRDVWVVTDFGTIDYM